MLSGAYALDVAAGRHMLVRSGIECTASTLLPAMNCPIWNDHMQLFSCPRRFASQFASIPCTPLAEAAPSAPHYRPPPVAEKLRTSIKFQLDGSNARRCREQ